MVGQQLHSQAGASHTAVPDQLGHHPDNGVGGNRKADARIRAAGTDDGGVDADHLAAAVEQGPSRISRVYGGVGLDDIVDFSVGDGGDGTAESTDDSGCEGGVQAERIADRINHPSDLQIASFGQFNRVQHLCGSVDFQDGQVVVRSYAGHLRVKALAVGKSHRDGVGLVHDVVVADDMSLFVPYETGSRTLFHLVNLEREEPVPDKRVVGDRHDRGRDLPVDLGSAQERFRRGNLGQDIRGAYSGVTR